MIKRPLNSRFNKAVLEGRKITTIRDNPWPIGKPIMLFNWSDVAYRSRQIDVAPVVATGFWKVYITHGKDGSVSYDCGKESGPELWRGEGFDSQEDMDAWFRAAIKPGHISEKTLMLFKLVATSPTDSPPVATRPR